MIRLNPIMARVADDEDGLSLVELLVAMFVLAVAVVAMAAVATSSMATLRLARDRQHATNASSAAIEDARSRDFDDLVLDDAASGLPSPACYNDEPLVTETAPADPVPFQSTAGPSDKITVTMYITWFDDPDDGTTEDCSSQDDMDGKRLTAVATWSEGGTERELIESTVVARAGRGLPVPDFGIGVDSFVNFSQDELDAQEEKCVDHVLRNFGAEDSYDWSIRAADGGKAVQNNLESGAYIGSYGGQSVFATDGKRWAMRAFFEHPVQPTPPDVTSYSSEVDAESNGVELMVDDNIDGFPEGNHPDISRVDNDELARLWICYIPTKAKATDKTYTDRRFEITVRSRFDSRVQRSVEHDVTIGTIGTPFRLTDTDDTQDHRRANYTQNGSFNNVPVFRMGPVDTLQPFLPHPSPGNGYGGGFLPNWDTDHDSDVRNDDGDVDDLVGYPGTRMPPGGSGDVTGPDGNTTTTNLDMLWHRQFTSDSTVIDRAQLEFWSSFDTALDVHQGVKGSFSTGDERTVEYRVQLEILRNNESSFSPPRIIWDSTLSYSHTQAGWMKQTVPMAFSSPLPTLGKNEYLRLRLHCLSSSAAACHVAYDSEDYPSILSVAIQ